MTLDASGPPRSGGGFFVRGREAAKRPVPKGRVRITKKPASVEVVTRADLA